MSEEIAETLPVYDPKALDRARQAMKEMPSSIDRYRVLECIGGGGMGEVFVAEQTTPIKRRVALKIIKAGMDTRQVVARFEAERQALAMMDHPNIARVFDAGSTDEGDLMAAAKVSFTTSREPDSQYDESYNGFRIAELTSDDKVDPYMIPGKPESGLIDLVQNVSPLKTGDACDALQCYNYRLCLTRDKANQIPIEAPPNYDPKHYELLARYIAARIASGDKLVFGTRNGGSNAFLKMSPLPHGKTDVNNSFYIGSDYIGYSTGYPTASYSQREVIAKEHENYTRGFLYFLGNDTRVPESIRKDAKEWGLSKDEFPDTHGWPYQLYVREARRMIGSYVMTQHDCESKTTISDSIGLGAYLMDSHGCQRMVHNGVVAIEGQFYTRIPKAYPISYRAIVPKQNKCTNLLVPACCSASHVAYASVRMEPVFMILGQSAAAAAAIAIDGNIDIQSVNYAKLAADLERGGQILHTK